MMLQSDEQYITSVNIRVICTVRNKFCNSTFAYILRAVIHYDIRYIVALLNQLRQYLFDDFPIL